MKKNLDNHRLTKNQDIVDEKLTFYVCEKGLDTEINEVISPDEFFTRDPQDFTPNCHWYPVRVKHQGDMENWIKMRNQYLNCCWTPNQSQEERTKNSQTIKELEFKMQQLEIN